MSLPRFEILILSRHQNFPIGTTKKQEVVAAGSCCLEGLILRVQNVAGKAYETNAVWNGVSSASSGNDGNSTSTYVIVVVCLIILLGIIVAVTMYCKKNNRYQAILQNPKSLLT